MSANEEVLHAQATHNDDSNLKPASDNVFYGVYIPREDDSRSKSEAQQHVYTDKSEAMKVIRKYKKGRFKTFKSQIEAEEFAYQGTEQPISASNAPTVPTRVNSEEKASNFKGPKPQDLVRFRKCIENGDLEAVRKIIWENPRYLVSSGDTPAILQEGSRYNALHVASKAACTPDMCDLLLTTVGNTDFVRLLYGEEDSSSYLDRAQILLDLYLNTPDKGLNETPLHFAVKFGFKEVVKVLVSYTQCVKTLRNKYGQTPADIICTRKGQEDEILKRDIHALLDEQFYVPVLRSDDNTLQPLIGEPFSPTSPPHLNFDPISPRVEVRAIAGPMNRSQAVEFRKKWKTPPRLRNAPTKRDSSLDDSFNIMNSPRGNTMMRLQDTEKGLERVGRDLAKEYHVAWKEYWPFLGTFADLTSTDGLLKLEKFFKQRFNDIPVPRVQERNMEHEIQQEAGIELDEINTVCNKLSSLEIANNHITDNFDSRLDLVQRRLFDDIDDNDETSQYFTPPSSPKSTCSSSDEDMYSAEEGPGTFIKGETPSRLDYAVYEAISSANINLLTHPYIYRWRHQLMIIMEYESLRFGSSLASRRRLLQSPGTPRSPWF